MPQIHDIASKEELPFFCPELLSHFIGWLRANVMGEGRKNSIHFRHTLQHFIYLYPITPLSAL